MIKIIIKLIIIGSLIANVSLFVILFTPIVEFISKPIIVGESSKKSQVIVILSSGCFDTENGFPSFSTTARIHKGAELYKKGYAEKIICVGANYLNNSKKTVGQVMKESLLIYGIPEKNIYVQDKIPGDWNYYLNFIDMIKSFKGVFDFNESIIVTSPQNTFRIKKIFIKQGINPTVVFSDKCLIYPYNWHVRFENFRDVANEYWAIFLFYILGRI